METLISCGDTAYAQVGGECFLASLSRFTNCPQCVERLRPGTSSSIRVGCPVAGTHLLQAGAWQWGQAAAVPECSPRN